MGKHAALNQSKSQQGTVQSSRQANYGEIKWATPGANGWTQPIKN